MKIFKFGPVGRIRIKGAESAPKEWKRTLWDKIKTNDLFTPINIHDENNIREIKIFFNKKVFVIGINLFLFSFIYSFVKDFYIILQARNNIVKINSIDFTKEIPTNLIAQNEILNSKFKSNPTKNNDTLRQNSNRWVAEVRSLLKQKFWESNYQIMKSTALPLANDLLILLMISKYYWKRKKV